MNDKDENFEELFNNDFFKDEFDTRVEKHLKSYNRRIEALEKKFKTLGGFSNEHAESISENTESIEILEKWKKEFRKVDEITEQYKQRQKVMKEQIAELRSYIDLQTREIHERSHNFANKIEEQIADLQLKHEIYDSHIVGENYIYPMIYKLEEVLRELNQIVKGIAFDLNKEGNLTAYNYNHYRERLQENEEKLDAGSARQTENDKCKEVTGFSLKEIELLKEIYLKEKTEKKEKMTDDEIMRFNEEVMAKVNKRKVQPLEASGGEKCEECGGYRMGERMMHTDWCSHITTSTTAEKLPETEPEEDIRAITIQGNLYWMPKVEANKLIEGFLKGLKGLIILSDMEYFPKFQKSKYDQLIKEYEGMLKRKFS